jgi:hypothetical protein
MHDTADYATIIHSRLASHILGQMRLDLSPLFVIQPKQIAPHDRHSESQAQRISNRFSQQRFYWVSALILRGERFLVSAQFLFGVPLFFGIALIFCAMISFATVRRREIDKEKKNRKDSAK